jgi:tetratricopeptide (TPR) repeat protein
MKRLLAGLLLAGVTIAAYWPSLAGQFIFDDVSLVTNSPLVKAGDGLYRMWFTTQPVDYWPLTNSSFWLEWRVWGTNPVGYHVLNLVLHIASAFLVWAVLRRLAIPGAFLGALIFAVHPVNVESVAWIGQRKNTLSMVFFLLSIFWFLDAESGNSDRAAPFDRWYWLSFSAFVLAMLSKGSVAILPAVLWLIAWWRHGRITTRDVWRSAPFWVVAIALTLVNIGFQADKLVEPIRQASALERLLGAGAVIWFYLFKALLPINLAFVYPQWQVRADAFQWWLPLVLAAIATVFLWSARRHRAVRAALAAWLLFCLALVPVMGFTDVYFMKYSLVADHYQYIASLAVAACVAAGLARLKPRRIGLVTSTVLVCLLAAGSWRQSHLYAGNETLYRGTLKTNPSAWLAQNNLGAILLNRGDNAEALQHIQEALRLKADYPAAQSNLCHILVNLRQMDAAVAPCARAIQFNPGDALVHSSLGSALASLGRLDEAQHELELALKLNKDVAGARRNLANVHAAKGNALLDLGKIDEADAQLRMAIALEPELADAHRSLGDLLLKTGRLDDAAVEYSAALAYDPQSAEGHNNLGVLLARRGQPDEAARQFRAALAIQPDFAEARANLAAVLDRQRRSKR